MSFLITAENTGFSYVATFVEPNLDLLKEESRLLLGKKLIKSFGLHLNEIKYNFETLSNSWITFSKILNPGFFQVSYGLEEFSVSARDPLDEKQIAEFCGKIFELSDKTPVSIQKMTLNQHFNVVESKVDLFFQSINPHTPSKFDGILDSRGVSYNLKIPEDQLSIHIALAKSVFVKEGLFFYVEMQFFPNKYEFYPAFAIAKKHYDFILDTLNLSIKGEL